MNYSNFFLAVSTLSLLLSSQINPKENVNHKKITINVLKNDELKISQIGEVVKIIPLHQTTSDLFLSTNRVIFDETEDCLFVTYGTFPVYVYQYRFSTGEQVRIIKKDYPVQQFIFPDQKRLGIICRDEIFKYDFKGNLIHKLRMQKTGDVFFFNNSYWRFNIEFTGKGFDRFLLFSTENFEIVGSEYEIIHKRGNCEPAFLKVSREPFFNSTGGALYFSHQEDPVLYRLKENKINAVCEYAFNTSDFTCPDFFSRRQALLGDHWLMITYNYKAYVNSFFCSLKTNESYNLKNGLIKDDLFGTEGISAHKIRIVIDNYFCFVLPADEIKPGLVAKHSDSKLCLVLMKVK